MLLMTDKPKQFSKEGIREGFNRELVEFLVEFPI